MNINGKNGPTLKKIFSCDNCKYLINITLNNITHKYQYKCYHDDIIKNNNRFNIMMGDVSADKITPYFCPFLINKMRNEKLKELKII